MSADPDNLSRLGTDSLLFTAQEVVVQTTQPTAPDLDLWVDPDEDPETFDGYTRPEADEKFLTKTAAQSLYPQTSYVNSMLASKWSMWAGTQAEYDALPTKDPATLYVVHG